MLTDKERELCLRTKENRGLNGTNICREFSCSGGLSGLLCPIGKYKVRECSNEVAYETAIKLLNEDEKERNNMSDTLTITKEKVLEAASKCSTAKEVLKTIFPEVFEDNRYFNLNNTDPGTFSALCRQIGLSSLAIQQDVITRKKEYRNHSIFLSKINLDWILYDNGDHYSLVPIKK